MDRFITVKGVAQISAPADTVVLEMTLQSRHKKYDRCMTVAAEKKSRLEEIIVSAGFQTNDIKTKYFNIAPDYAEKRQNNTYQQVFDCWECEHELLLRFPFDSQRLHQVLSLLSSSDCDCVLSLDFTVADKTAVQEKLLAEAALNARKKAEVLSNAMNCKLGQLLNINYNWQDINIFSTSRFRYTRSQRLPMASQSRACSMRPDNISVEDSAEFIWELI